MTLSSRAAATTRHETSIIVFVRPIGIILLMSLSRYCFAIPVYYSAARLCGGRRKKKIGKFINYNKYYDHYYRGATVPQGPSPTIRHLRRWRLCANSEITRP